MRECFLQEDYLFCFLYLFFFIKLCKSSFYIVFSMKNNQMSLYNINNNVCLNLELFWRNRCMLAHTTRRHGRVTAHPSSILVADFQVLFWVRDKSQTCPRASGELSHNAATLQAHMRQA